MAQESKYTVLIWNDIYGFKRYLPSLARLRQLDYSDELKSQTQWVIDFKKKGKHADEVRTLCDSLAIELGCNKIIAIPPSDPSNQPNELQKLYGEHISRISRVESRKYNHRKTLPDDYSTSYIITGLRTGEKILLVDDICTTGRTLMHFKEKLESFGFEVKPACLGFYYKLEPVATKEITLKAAKGRDTPGKEITFKTLYEVYKYLKDEWKISKSAIYEHQKEGKIRPIKNGEYPLKAVEAYARRWLKRRELDAKLEEDELRRERKKAELAKIIEQAKLARLKREREEGMLIPRADFELELASRATVLMAYLESMANAKASEIIKLVEGSTEKMGELISFLRDCFKEALNEYCNVKEYHVLFKQGG